MKYVNTIFWICVVILATFALTGELEHISMALNTEYLFEEGEIVCLKDTGEEVMVSQSYLSHKTMKPSYSVYSSMPSDIRVAEEEIQLCL